jgi:enamine deaminase RidA (YjgF/YER057c/UK114 family)
MGKRCVFAPNGPPAQGPYSHAVAVGNLLFVSGQGPVAPDGSGLRKGTIEDEARLTLSNLKAILEDAGSGMRCTRLFFARTIPRGRVSRPDGCPSTFRLRLRQ